MTEKTRECQKCRQTVPSEAKFCPFCGIELSGSATKDLTKLSYTELVLEAKRIEVAITKDDRMIEQFLKKIQDGSLKLASQKKPTGLSRAELIDLIKKDILGYVWALGGFVHPLLGELERIKEELNRRERVDDYQQVEKFIRELQNRN